MKARIFSRCRYVLMWCFLAPGVTAFYGYSIAGESEAETCSAFVDYPALYDDCIQNSSAVSDESKSTFADGAEDPESCYCDIRKQQQVTRRMQKKAAQDAEQNRMLSEGHTRPK